MTNIKVSANFLSTFSVPNLCVSVLQSPSHRPRNSRRKKSVRGYSSRIRKSTVLSDIVYIYSARGMATAVWLVLFHTCLKRWPNINALNKFNFKNLLSSAEFGFSLIKCLLMNWWILLIIPLKMSIHAFFLKVCNERKSLQIQFSLQSLIMID